MAPVDVLLVSLGSTAGLRAADAELRDALRPRRGARASSSRPRRSATSARSRSPTSPGRARRARAADAPGSPRTRRTPSSTARRPRRCCGRAPARSASTRSPRRPAPGATALWQRPRERRRLVEAPLLVPWSAQALDGAPDDLAPTPLVVPGARRAVRARRAVGRATRHRRHLRRRPGQEGARPRARRVGGGAPRGRDARRRGPGRRPRAGAPPPASRSPAGLDRDAYRALRAPREALRHRPAPRGPRDRPARGARRRLRARDDARARAVRRAADRARARRAARRRRPRARRSAPRSTTRRRATTSARCRCSRRSRAPRSTASSRCDLLPRLLR